jgi:predicted secreted protein
VSLQQTVFPAILASVLAAGVLAGCERSQEPPVAVVERPAAERPGSPPMPESERAGPAFTLTDEEDGRGVILRRGHVVEVRLPADRASGFTWIPAGNMLPVMSTDGVPRYETSNGASDDAPGIEIWRFIGREPGHTHLVFEYRRPLEADAPPHRTVMYHFDVE